MVGAFAFFEISRRVVFLDRESLLEDLLDLLFHFLHLFVGEFLHSEIYIFLNVPGNELGVFGRIRREVAILDLIPG